MCRSLTQYTRIAWTSIHLCLCFLGLFISLSDCVGFSLPNAPPLLDILLTVELLIGRWILCWLLYLLLRWSTHEFGIKDKEDNASVAMNGSWHMCNISTKVAVQVDEIVEGERSLMTNSSNLGQALSPIYCLYRGLHTWSNRSALNSSDLNWIEEVCSLRLKLK